MIEEKCPHCDQPLPKQRDAFCPACRGELSKSDGPDNPSTQNQMSQAEESATRFARERASRGDSRETIINELVRRGFDRGQAVFIVHQQTTEPKRDPAAKAIGKW